MNAADRFDAGVGKLVYMGFSNSQCVQETRDVETRLEVVAEGDSKRVISHLQ